MKETTETQTGIFCYDRKQGRMTEERVLGDRLLRLAYTRPGRLCLGWMLFLTAFFSRLLGWYANRPASRKRIAKTVSDLQMDLSGFRIPEGGFRCFNDFFTRELLPGARDFSGEGIHSPADCRMTVWQTLEEELCIPVKGRSFTVPALLGKEGAEYAGRFSGGSLCVARLCPSDYHRFHFPAAGRVLKHWRISGRYHSVSPLALSRNLDIFPKNVREVTMLDLGTYGLCAFLEVGAFGVASITQTCRTATFSAGEEKGFFSFGGSTVILIFEPGKIRFSQDLIQYSSQGIETILPVGDIIATGKTELAVL